MNTMTPKNTVSNDAWQRRVITTGFVGGLIGACTAVAAASVIGTAASAHDDDLVDAGAVAYVGEGDIATVGAGLTVDGLLTSLPTCVMPDEGPGSGSGDGSGDGSGSGDGNGSGSGDGSGAGAGSGSGNGNGDGTGTGDGSGSGNGSGDGSGNGGNTGGGSLIDIDSVVDLDDTLHPFTGRNLVDASVFGDVGNTWGGNLLNGAGDVVIGGHDRSNGALIDVDGAALLDLHK